MFRKAVLPPVAAGPTVLGRVLDALTLKGHALAVRLEQLPDGFGDATPVDETDPRAVRAEWRRQFHLWVDYSPEQVFALKAGALILGAALAVVLAAIAFI